MDQKIEAVVKVIDVIEESLEGTEEMQRLRVARRILIADRVLIDPCLRLFPEFAPVSGEEALDVLDVLDDLEDDPQEQAPAAEKKPDLVEVVRASANLVEIAMEFFRRKGDPQNTLRWSTGAKFRALCPFHAEKTPSFYVDAEKQLFYCFGCGAGGDVFKFLMLMEKIEFPEALKRLAARYGIDLPSAPAR